MQDTMRIGAAALGGYVLGRTKKAKTAITLALWLSGKGRPSDIARGQAVKALQSDKGQELMAQLRGPVMSAGRQAALSVFESQAGRLSESIGRRTDQLSEPANGRSKTSRGKRRKADEQDDDELSERRRPAGRKPDRERRAPRSRDAEEPDEYDDEYEAEDEYDDETEEDDDAAEGEEADDEDGAYEDEYEDEADEEADDEDEADEEADDEDDQYDDEYEDDEYDDDDEYEDEPATRRRAS